MKKFLSILAVFAFVITSGFLFTACGGNKNKNVTAENGFVYSLNSDKQSYSLTGYDKAIPLQAEMVVANEINKKPVTEVKNAIFYDDNTDQGNNIVKTLTIPDNVKILGDSCFRGLSALETVNIGSGLRSLDTLSQTYNDFNPASVFFDCNNLTTFNVSASNPSFRAEGACLIQKAGTATTDKGRGQTNEYDMLVVSGKGNVIPDSVQIIGEFCFADRQSSISATIPSQIKEIRDHAFYGCNMTGRLNLNDGLVTIGSYAFANIDGITDDLVIPDSVKTIEWDAFADLVNITSIKIGEGCETIGDSAFSVGGTDTLKTLEFIEIGKNVKSLPENTFARYVNFSHDPVPAVNEIRILGNGNIEINNIWGYLTDTSTLTKFTFPASQSVLKALEKGYIVEGAAQNMEFVVTSGTLPSNFAELIAPGTSHSVKISLVIKAEVTKIESGALSKSNVSYNSVEIEYNDDMTIEGVLTENEVTILTAAARDVKHFTYISNLYITQGEIVKGTFNSPVSGGRNGECLNNVKNLRLGADVTLIDPEEFEECYERESIMVDAGNPVFTTDDSGTCLLKDNVLVLGCKTTEEIPRGITEIGISAFYKTEAEITEIREGVVKINSKSFYGCMMGTIYLPSTLTDYGYFGTDTFAFSNCSKLYSIEVSSANTHFSSVGGVLYNYEKTEIIFVPANIGQFTVADTVSVLTRKAFYDINNHRWSQKGATITLGDGITKIENSALTKRGFEKAVLPISYYRTTWRYNNQNHNISYTGGDLSGTLTQEQIQFALEDYASAFILGCELTRVS